MLSSGWAARVGAAHPPVVQPFTAVSYTECARDGPPARAGLDDQVPIV
jgi:hypothetical protein